MGISNQSCATWEVEAAAKSLKTQSPAEANSVITRSLRYFLTIILVVDLYIPSSVVGKPITDDLKSIKAVEGLIDIFDRYSLVALGEVHGSRTAHDFIISLIRHPSFPNKVNDIVVEFGNAKYQNLMDRYIDGEMIAYMELRQAWRNTTQPTTVWDLPIYERFFATVRAINQNLPKTKRVRVLLGDPPVDWDVIKSTSDFMPFTERDEHFARVVEKEVFNKGRKALLIAGTFHLIRCQMKFTNVALRVEKLRPGSLFIVMPHHGFAERNDELEMRLSSLPKPALVIVKNTWLGDLSTDLIYPVLKRLTELMPDGTPVPDSSPLRRLKFQDITDAYLYFGPKASLIEDRLPPEVERDVDYKRELDRRRKIWGIG